MMVCKRGELYMAKLASDRDGGSLQQGVRPVLVISNDMANKYSPVITVVPLTSKLSKNRLPTHVFIKKCEFLAKSSLVLAEQIMSLNKCRLEQRLGSIKDTEYAEKVDIALKIQLGV